VLAPRIKEPPLPAPLIIEPLDIGASLNLPFPNFGYNIFNGIRAVGEQLDEAFLNPRCSGRYVISQVHTLSNKEVLAILFL
jgi:hypothetical protein